MLVLASASPRRQELLRNAGIEFTVLPADVDEIPFEGEDACACAQRLAREKAWKVWRARPGDVVLGADTIVVVDGTILGKPVDHNDAVRMLRLLAGRTHQVVTGVCLVRLNLVRLNLVRSNLVRANEDTVVDCETTWVTMAELSEQEILDYVATGEPMDKAGAYAIQGIASRWIPRIEGDYSNVVGLPVARVYRLLRDWKMGMPGNRETSPAG